MILTQVIDSVVDYLAEAFPDFPTVEKYPRCRKKIPLPAILVEIGDFEEFENTGDDQLGVGCRFEARVILDPTLPDAEETVRILAAQVAQWLMTMERVNPHVSNFRIVDVSEDMFRPELRGYLVWLVEFAADINVGNIYWAATLAHPAEIWVGHTPLVGAEHEDEYEEITGNA